MAFFWQYSFPTLQSLNKFWLIMVSALLFLVICIISCNGYFFHTDKCRINNHKKNRIVSFPSSSSTILLLPNSMFDQSHSALWAQTPEVVVGGESLLGTFGSQSPLKSKGYPLWTLELTCSPTSLPIIPSVASSSSSSSSAYIYDLIIDARSPGEFEEDHIPGAINLPVLNDEERAIVGTLYTTDTFEARRVGAGLVSKNIGNMLDRSNEKCCSKALMDIDSSKIKDTRVLVYCWRGGERSNSLATILSRIGFHTTLLKGGYKSYRKSVLTLLDTLEHTEMCVIEGLTGTGKGQLLEALSTHDEKVLLLEEIANHRGSAFGAVMQDKQPSQKLFESLLVAELRKLNVFDYGYDNSNQSKNGNRRNSNSNSNININSNSNSNSNSDDGNDDNNTKSNPRKSRRSPIFVEAESKMVGQREIPPRLFKAMQSSLRVSLQLSLEDRVKRIRKDYTFLETERGKNELLECINKIKRISGPIATQWQDWIEKEDWDQLVGSLLTDYYDAAYKKANKKLFGSNSSQKHMSNGLEVEENGIVEESRGGESEGGREEEREEDVEGEREGDGKGIEVLTLDSGDPSTGSYDKAARELISLINR